MASPVIELRSVGIKFNEDRVLQNVNLTVLEGEIFVLIGPSGHGKSVLLKIMAGLLEPTEGEVWIHGLNFFKQPRDKQDELRRKMGMLFQKNALFDSLTTKENVGFPLRETTALDSKQISDKVMTFLEAVGIGHAAGLYPDEISGGMQKRLGIARALALDPEIVFYDDPTAGLDPITSRKIVDLILHLHEENHSTSIAITNDMNRAYQMGSRLGLIANSELVLTGTPEETQRSADPRVVQFIHGSLQGPLTEPT